MKTLEIQVTLNMTEGSHPGTTVALSSPRTVIGRKGADIVLTDSKISQQHAAIEIEGSKVRIVDLQSRNGIFVNGVQVKDALLSNLDEIRLGVTTLKIMIVDDLGSFKTRNLKGADVSVPPAEKRDIESMIDDELKHFSKWDLSQPSAEISSVDATPARTYYLEILQGPDAGKRLKIDKKEITLGRGKVDVLLRDGDVSRIHAAIEVGGTGRALLKDMGSTNGTFLNSKKVTEAKLKDGDRIEIGGTLLRFIAGD